jgi:uncharacterized protein YcfL
MNRVMRAILALAIMQSFVAIPPLAIAQTQTAGQTAQAQPPSPVKWVNPIRGTAQIQYTRPQTKRVKDQAVTTVMVKNVSNGPIAKLKVEEFWWDRNGNPVVSNQAFSKKPVMPGEVVTFTLTTPYSASMNANNCKFSHAYGDIKPQLVPKL